MNLNDLMFWRDTSPVMSLNEAGGTSGGQITQANVKNFIVKAVGNVSEGANGDFVSPTYDLSEIKDAILADSYIKASVMKYSQLIFKAGYSIVSDNDAAAEYIRGRFRMMSFMTGTPIDILFQQIADDLVAYSNVFLAKSRTDMTNIGGLQAKGVLSQKPVGGYFRVDPTTVQIKADKTGTIKQYQQEAGQNKTTFKPEDLVHIFMDKQGGELFGTPRVVAAMEDVKILRKIEGNVLQLVYRFAIPLYQMKIGIPEAGLMATDQEINDAKSEIEKLANDGILVTNERTGFEVIGAEGHAMDAVGYLNYFESRVFSSLNTSASMMGRGGAKQDADSMEQQTHDAVKYYQRVIKTFIEEKMINELLLEGGYNPYMNEGDIVHFNFEEINLDTKVKMQTHALNLFQGNAISFEELRFMLGLDTDSVDESRLHDNMIKQPNALELVNAKLASSGGQSASANTGTSGPSKQNVTKDGTTKSTMQPTNQHGTGSAHIKESLEEKEEKPAPSPKSPPKTAKHIDEWKKKFPEVYKRYMAGRNDIIEHEQKSASVLPLLRESISKEIKAKIDFEAQSGVQKAMEDSGQMPDQMQKIAVKQLHDMADKATMKFFKELQKRLKHAKTRADREAAFGAIEYRMRFICDHVISKAYWFGYVKACAQFGIENVYVDFDKSEDGKRHDSLINPKRFSIDDIPSYHAYFTCKVGLEDKGGEKNVA